ncbi:AbrB/MazE/SpoVT family DNA-binding domain-containing protein [Cryobacterium luteum]|uniref:AbrB/MazE/SpoVT family DNA-binding domain-containing protein n=1 Tax=Cryobacterium luteum TaxID=1424661 RepID=A0A1H8FDZ7_9MICO|nr:AbrB/MazE/SpoVT family DNA-binding domain-containing protein [Cryobacterium luteum]TFB93337.1 AbrB/MazE/SpoVT family DNA-binding domain-containing protein [Cryobacterium luteum]SEN29826.1 looped-hinge helix DNA binding domain-containing protein, AbrB family [Cryobacterium luteum]
MKAIVTLSSKGQLTLPAAVRKALRLEQGDRLEISIDEADNTITIAPIANIETLSARISSYVTVIEPVIDVDDYYQEHRNDERAD